MNPTVCNNGSRNMLQSRSVSMKCLLASLGLALVGATLGACAGDDVSLGRNAVKNNAGTGGAPGSTSPIETGGSVTKDPVTSVGGTQATVSGLTTGGVPGSTSEFETGGSVTKDPVTSVGGSQATVSGLTTGGASSSGGATSQIVTSQPESTGGSTPGSGSTIGTHTGGVYATGGAATSGGSTWRGGGVTLTARVGAVSPNDELGLIGEWHNGSDQTIFLAGCGEFEAEYQDSTGAWVNVGWFFVCNEEPVAIGLAPGQTKSDGAEAPHPNGIVATTWRLTGFYGVGCTPGVKFSQADCAQRVKLTSNVVTLPD